MLRLLWSREGAVVADFHLNEHHFRVNVSLSVKVVGVEKVTCLDEVAKGFLSVSNKRRENAALEVTVAFAYTSCIFSSQS